MSDSERSEESILTKNSGNDLKRHRLKRKGNLLQIIQTEGELKYRNNFENLNAIEDLYDWIHCTKCQTSFKNDILEGKEIHSHPLLKVLMCKSCCEYYGDGDFSLDEDDEDKYCRWCGEGGKLFLCSKCICGFCPRCIKQHFGMKKVNEIKKDDDWVCYMCNPEPLWKLRSICHLAQKQSESYRNKKSVFDSHRKINIKRGKNPNQHDALFSSKQSEKEITKYISANDVGSERNSRWMRRSSRLDEKAKSGDKAISLSPNGEPTSKKRKITEDNEKDGSSFFNGSSKRITRSRKTVWTSTSETSSSESDEDIVEEKVIDLKRKEKETAKNKHTQKLKEILKIAEITSQLCFKLCKKESRKLDRKDYMSNEKLVTNCENLKSMIILMSSSLSTVHSMITSLEKKLGGRGEDGVFGGNDGTRLLKTISHVLLDKRLKTTHLMNVVNDILNRYPYIELGATLFRDSVHENSTKSISINREGTSAREEDSVICRGDSCELKTRESSTNEASLSCLRGTPVVKQISTDMSQSRNHFSKENNGQASENTPSYGVCPAGKKLRKDCSSGSDTDMKLFYVNSSKLKEQLLKDSSDETSFFSSEINISSSSDDEREKVKVGNSKKRMVKKWNRKKLSKEETAIMKLTNLRSLEQKKGSQGSDSETICDDFSYKKELADNRSKKVDTEKNDSDGFPSRLENDSQSSDEIKFPGSSDEMTLMRKFSSTVKDYVLGTTTSESAEETSEKNAKKPKKHPLQSQPLSRKLENLRGIMTCYDSTDSEKEEFTRKRIRKRLYSSESLEESSDSFVLCKRKKPKERVIKSSDSDISCVSVERPKTKVNGPGKSRRTIRKILKKGSLQLETRQAIENENERKKKMAERNEYYKKFFPDMANAERLVLDFDRDTGEVLLEVPKAIVKSLKPHQKQGVKFMWDNCFGSLACLEENSGSGCILAHCMGLGKTLQIITLTATIIQGNLGVNTVLILCPLNVVNNWMQEFDRWLKDVDVDIPVYNIVKYRKGYERFFHVRQWYEGGGVLILSYDMMRTLTRLPMKSRDEGSRSPNLFAFLLDPGPDLVVCDEGHVIKNTETSLSKIVSTFKTSRRIVLTGTPLQNNLLEYHSMVQFIKPNILGTKQEFMNRFANPIRNGQFEDSTTKDVKLMRARAHVLHTLLDGCIQRFNYSVLTPFLPEKHEYVISIRLTETQAKLYRYYAEKCKKTSVNEKGMKLFSDFHWLQKIWTHPQLVRSYGEEREAKNEGDTVPSSDESVVCIEEEAFDEAYWKTMIKTEEYEDLRSSGKILLLFDILARCRRIGDKVLLFSQSLKNLDLIENFLMEVNSAKNSENNDKIPPEFLDTWVMGKDYFRMDGSTGSDTRSKWCKWFNNKENSRARLFLISTKAGGLGINLIGANRVVIFDASWNPSHDVQSIFRIYRFGQSKICYIYRFVAEATMEEKIYERQVTKLSLEKRVLDEYQIERHYTIRNFQDLYKYDPLPKGQWPVPIVPRDLILAEILKIRKDVIVTYHEHDSLLENKQEEELTEEERKAAWEDFEKEKFMVENQLQRKAFAPGDGQAMDELTNEVLRITGGMCGAAGMNVPRFTPSQTPDFNHRLPCRIVDVQSLDANLIPISTNNTNFAATP